MPAARMTLPHFSISRFKNATATSFLANTVPVVERTWRGADLLTGSAAGSAYGGKKGEGTNIEGVAVVGECVEEGVGGGVVRLPGVAERADRRGEQHERGEVTVPGELVEQPRGVDLGAQDGVELFAGEVLDEPVVEDAGRVDDGGEVRDAVEQRGERVAVGRVAGRGADPGVALPV